MCASGTCYVVLVDHAWDDLFETDKRTDWDCMCDQCDAIHYGWGLKPILCR